MATASTPTRIEQDEGDQPVMLRGVGRDGDRPPSGCAGSGAGVPVYRIVDLPSRRVEVGADPTGRGKSARHQERTNYDEPAEVPVTIDGREAVPASPSGNRWPESKRGRTRWR